MDELVSLPLRVLLVDDEPLARLRLRNLLADCVQPAADVVAEEGSALGALQRIERGGVDLVLLDIHMPGTHGTALARMLRELPAPPAIVFVTAHAEHALEAFELEAVDYLTKPVRLERLQAALQKVKRLVHAPQALQADSTDEALVIQERGKTLRVPLSDVLYLKAELKYVTVRTAQASYILDASLQELEEKHAARMVRVHRNALVARRAIRALERHHDPEEGEGWAVRLAGVPEPLAVSRRQLAALRQVIAGG